MEGTKCNNCVNGKCTCTTMKVPALKTSGDYEKFEKKVFRDDAFEDYIGGLTAKEQPKACTIDNPDCENCGS